MGERSRAVAPFRSPRGLRGPAMGLALMAVSLAGPARAEPDALARDVAQAFAGTAAVVGTWDAAGMVFRPGDGGPEGEAARLLPTGVIVIRPVDPRWRGIRERWRRLRTAEAAATGAAGRTLAEDGVRRVKALAETAAALRRLVEAERPEEVVEAGALAFAPAIAGLGWRAGRGFEARRDRMALEVAVAKRLGMERGALEQDEAPLRRGFLGALPDGRACFVPLGEE